MRMIGVLAVALFLLALPAGADAYDRLVNPFHSCSLSGTPEYDTLQDAVNAANPGDQIGVCPGTYDQTVLIGTSVTLTAIGSVIISPSGQFPPTCFEVDAADVTIRYFVMQHCNIGVLVFGPGALVTNNQFSFANAGVLVAGPGAIVQNNLVEDSSTGIEADGGTAGTAIKNNTLRRLTFAGVSLAGNGVIVNKNSIQNAVRGILVQSVSDTTVSFNSVSFGGTGIDIENTGSNNQITRNVVTRNSSIDCFWDQSGNVAFSKNTCGTEFPAGVWD